MSNADDNLMKTLMVGFVFFFEQSKSKLMVEVQNPPICFKKYDLLQFHKYSIHPKVNVTYVIQLSSKNLCR